MYAFVKAQEELA